MNDLNLVQKPATWTRSGNLLALFVRAAFMPALLILVLAGGATASAQVVTNTADSGPGTLRSAMTNAANGAVITFASNLSGATITLSNTLAINTNFTIDASALPGGIQINGNGAVQIFNVAGGTTDVLDSLTIANGYSTNVYSAKSGGGINNNGTLTLTNCTLSGNISMYGGGGINNNGGTLTLVQCTLSGNTATNNFGGGIYNNGLLTLNQCTLSGNAAGAGGGIANGGTLTLNQCTLSGNSAGSGGGIFNVPPIEPAIQGTRSGNNAENDGGDTSNGSLMTLNQCTLSLNSANIGGGIFNGGGTLTLNQCTLSENSSSNEGGGIANYGRTETFFADDYALIMMTNTIVAGNTSSNGADIYSEVTDITYAGSNLVQSVSNTTTSVTGPAPLTNAPDLAALGNYGGPTQTMPPLPGSPAIGAGSVAVNTFTNDQRGFPRTQNGLIDLGAVELQSPAVNPPVLQNLTLPAVGGANGLQFTFTNAPVADFTVLTATNVALALTTWTVLGEVQQVAPGQYQFTDPQAATNLLRFYSVRSP